MSRERPTGFNWVDAMRRLEARRRAQAIAFFTDYVGKEVRIDRHTAVDSMATTARERPWALSANVLRRAAEQAQNERFTTPRRPLHL
jgi:hypothetical protein